MEVGVRCGGEYRRGCSSMIAAEMGGNEGFVVFQFFIRSREWGVGQKTQT